MQQTRLFEADDLWLLALSLFDDGMAECVVWMFAGYSLVIFLAKETWAASDRSAVVLLLLLAAPAAVARVNVVVVFC